MKLLADTPVSLRYRLATAAAHKLLNSMIGPFAVIYLARATGSATAGAMVAIGAIAGVVAGLVGGSLADRFGRRPVLIVGEVGAALGYGAMALSVSSLVDLPMVAYASLLLATTLSTMTLPAHESLILDVTSPNDRSRVYLINFWAVNVAMGLGGLIGGLLFPRWFPAVLVFAAVVMLLAALASTFRIVETHKPAPLVRPVGWGRDYGTVLRDGRFMLLMVAAVLSISIELQLGGYIAVRIADELPKQAIVSGVVVTGVMMVGILRAGNATLVVALTAPTRKLVGVLDHRARLIVGLALFTSGFAVLTFSLHAATLLIALVILTIGEILYVPEKQAIVGNAIPESSRGVYTAVYSLNFAIGFLVASAVLALSGAVPALYITAAVVCFGLLSMFIFTRVQPTIVNEAK